MFKSVDQCMAQPIGKVKKAAKDSGIDYITLDTTENKLKVCKELSLHQQDFITKQGVNPIVQEKLKQQEKECGLCKP